MDITLVIGNGFDKLKVDGSHISKRKTVYNCLKIRCLYLKQNGVVDRTRTGDLLGHNQAL